MKINHGIICDRCHKYMTYEENNNISHIKAIRNEQYKITITHTSKTNKIMDLCDDCLNDFYDLCNTFKTNKK